MYLPAIPKTRFLPLSTAGITGFDGEQLFLHTSTAMTPEKVRER